MFSNSNAKTEVCLSLGDGQRMTGELSMGTNATIQALLAYNSPFLEFTGKDGQRRFVSKSHVAMIEPVEELKKPVLDTNAKIDSDPYLILKAAKGSDFADIRKSYLELAKIYHPDKVGQLSLPKEVTQYMNDMFRLINSAFMQVKSEMNVKEAEAHDTSEAA